METIKTLQEYMSDHQDNLTLYQVAMGISLRAQGLTYSDSIFVIDGSVDLFSLEKGYHLRIIDLGSDRFHIYGIEVISKGNIIVHENIPSNQLENHGDDLFRNQLMHLNTQGRIYYRVAKTQGGGYDLHEDLVVKYATDGSVSDYVNPLLCSNSTFPKPVSIPRAITEPLQLVNQDRNRVTPMVSDLSSTNSKQFPVNEKSPLFSSTSNAVSCSSTLSFCSKLLAALGGVALVIGILAVVGVITVIAPPVGIAVIVGGAVALGLGVGGACFFSSNKKTETNSTDTENLLPKMD
ncbi:hypothetical protein [Legionella waltersii]|uniref:Uncharacterized protein n=1 Tax=Legionella waltersii TaxID=66969 RepID=A0A0W1A5I9_9GAMM|nr:hypothetical protein [Legionella waltersii]KTD76642.1 hypothetical protein Lwal_2364 [Legionella waltersii]SNU94760.1 Uncharacterised protein [Legionella waltersii]